MNAPDLSFEYMTDRPAQVFDVFAVWDYVDGLPEHHNPVLDEACQEFASHLLVSCRQASDYIQTQPPEIARKAIASHNKNLAAIVRRDWRGLGLLVCCDCHKLFVPTKPRLSCCDGCWEEFNRGYDE